MEHKRDWISLSMVHGLGPVGFWKLIHQFGSPTSVLNASRGELKKAEGGAATLLPSLSDVYELRRQAELELKLLAKRGAEAIVFKDDDYPELLAETVNPPPVLYIHGDRELLNRPAVAMVGSRAATSYGRRVAFSLASDLATKHVAVISGLAAGIDAEAHSGCLRGGGKTIAVLGCGLDVTYPRSNGALYTQIKENGLLVSEYPLGTRPDGFRFPARNRIIAGMSIGVVVVEAARKSGSLITVQYALDEGRDVFSVPGQIDSVKSGGTHWLLQQGATLIVSADDIVDSLQVGSGVECEGSRGISDAGPELDPISRELLSIIEHYPMQRDELIRLSGMAPAKLSEHLLLLELEGMVELLPGDEVCRVDKTYN